LMRRRRETSLPVPISRIESLQDLRSTTGISVTIVENKNEPQRHRFTVDECNWMAEVGLLSGGPPVELLEGEIIHMAPMSPRHRTVVERFHGALQSGLAGRAHINVQRVCRLSNMTEMQPDLIVIKPGRDCRSVILPSGRDTLLVVEVSDTTFVYDRHVKLPLYAAHGVPEVWIVDLESRCVHFFRSLLDGRYTDVRVSAEPGAIGLIDFPDLTIGLAGLLT
jgi:Uma2 family endonuclease